MPKVQLTCEHGKDRQMDVCVQCLASLGPLSYEWIARLWLEEHPAEAVAQLIADGVLVCRICDGHGAYPPSVKPRHRLICPCKGSSEGVAYRLNLPTEEGDDA